MPFASFEGPGTIGSPRLDVAPSQEDVVAFDGDEGYETKLLWIDTGAGIAAVEQPTGGARLLALADIAGAWPHASLSAEAPLAMLPHVVARGWPECVDASEVVLKYRGRAVAPAGRGKVHATTGIQRLYGQLMTEHVARRGRLVPAEGVELGLGHFCLSVRGQDFPVFLRFLDAS